MSDRVATGRIVVRVLLTALVLAYVVNTIIVIAFIEDARLHITAMRLILTTVLAFLTYRGGLISRAILVGWLGFKGIAAILAVLSRGIVSIGSYWMLFFGSLFVIVAACLVFLPAARDFLRSQRSVPASDGT